MRKIKNTGKGGPEEKIKITAQALEELMTIAEIMEDYEFRVVQSSSSRNGTIEHNFIPTQKAESAHVHSEGADWVQDFFELRQQKLIPIGVAHGHGKHDTFYSSTDHDNFDKVLMECWGNNASKDVLDFAFDEESWEFKDGTYILRSFNETDMIVQMSGELPKHPFKTDKELRGLVKEILCGKLIKGQKGQVSGITVNQTGKDIYGINRYRERAFFFFPGEEPEFTKRKGDHPGYFVHKRNEIRYSLDAQIEIIDSDVHVEKDSLVKRLKERVELAGRHKPTAFKVQSAVRSPFTRRIQKEIAKVLALYATSDRPHAGHVRSAIAKSKGMGKKTLFNLGNLTEGDKKLDISPDETFKSLTNYLYQALNKDSKESPKYKAFVKDYEARKGVSDTLERVEPCIIKYFGLEIAEEPEVGDDVETPVDYLVEKHAIVIDPDIDKIFPLYEKLSSTFHYRKLASAANRIDELIPELKEFGIDTKAMEELQGVMQYQMTLVKAEFKENNELMAELLLNQYETSSSVKLYHPMRRVRNNLYALELNDKANELDKAIHKISEGLHGRSD